MTNNSTHYDVSERTFYLVYDSITATLAVSISISNLIVIFIYCFNTKIQSKTANLLLCDQSIVDLFNGAIVGGITVFSGDAPAKVKASIYQLSIALNLHTAALISVERYIFILRPFYHRTHVTITKVIMGVIISWCSSLIWIPCRLVHYNSANDVNWQSYVWFIAISDVVIFLLITAVGVLHLLTYRVVKGCIKQRYECSISCKNKKNIINKEKVKRRMREMRASKIFIAMFLAFLFTYAPVFITGIVYVSGGFDNVEKNDQKYFSLDLLFYLATSLFNPVVTLLFKEDYRKAIRKLVYSFHANKMLNTDSTSGSFPPSPQVYSKANGSDRKVTSSVYSRKIDKAEEIAKNGSSLHYNSKKSQVQLLSPRRYDDCRNSSSDSDGISENFVARALTFTLSPIRQNGSLPSESTDV